MAPVCPCSRCPTVRMPGPLPAWEVVVIVASGQSQRVVPKPASVLVLFCAAWHGESCVGWWPLMETGRARAAAAPWEALAPRAAG